MYATSTKSHVQSLEFICNVCKILGIIPPANNLCKNAVKYTYYLHKVYVIVLTIFLAISSSLAAYKRSAFYENSVLLILFLLNSCCLAMLNISTVLSTSFTNTWTRLNNGFILVDNKLHNCRQSFFEKSIIQIAIANGLFFISMLYICFVCWELDMDCVKDTFIHISSWYSFNVFIFIYSILTVLKNDFENMNALIANSKDATTVKAVATVLKNMTEDFNALFGWPLLFFAFRGALQLLVSIYFFLVLKELPSNSANMIAASSGYTLLVMIPTILLATSCGRVKAESERAELLSYEAQSEELQKLAPFLKKHAVKFSVAGFFEMDRSTVSGFLTTTVTYLIVLIQFNGVK